MAEHQKQGQDFVLKIDPTGGTTYDTVVCLKSFDFTSEDAEIDASSFCGTEILPGLSTEGIEFEGIQLYDPVANKISGADLYVTKQSKVKIGWQIAPVTPITGDVTKTGKGYLLSLSENYGLNEPCIFNASIKIAGSVTPTTTA